MFDLSAALGVRTEHLAKIGNIELPTINQILTDHFTWVIGLTPFAVVAYNVAYLSNGDPLVYPYLLRNLSIVTIVLGVLMPLISPTVVWLGTGWFFEQRRLPKEQRLNVHPLIKGVSFAVWFGFFGALPLTWAAIFVLTILFPLIIRLLIRCYFRLRKLFHKIANLVRATAGKQLGVNDLSANLKPILPSLNVAWAASFVVTTAFQLYVNNQAAWLPHESVVVKSQQAISAQVLSSDGTWTTYLTGANEVRITKTTDIVSRQPCYLDTSLFSRTVINEVGRVLQAKFHPKNPRQWVQCPSN